MSFLRKAFRSTQRSNGPSEIGRDEALPGREDTAHQAAAASRPIRSPGDQDAWALANRVQGLYRAQAALRDMLSRKQGKQAEVVSVRPAVDSGLDRAAVPSGTPAPRDDPWWPDQALPRRALVPPPGHCNFGLRTDPARAVACLVTGLRGPDLEAAVSHVVEKLRDMGGFKPVFLTDSDDLGPIVREGFVAEYISPADHADTKTAISEPRLNTLTRKWNIARVVDLRKVKAPLPAVRKPETDTPPPKPEPRGQRPRAAVVCWDLAHNPAGRAMVLYDLLERDYDVDLVGPIWSRFGRDVWPPIRDSDRKVRSFLCDRFEDFWPKAVALAADADYDLVVVCKPQLPGLLLGAMMKKTCDCALVLDIDDFELSFSTVDTAASLDELAAAGPDGLTEPYGQLAARVCDGLIPEIDARIVSNVALHHKYGGYIVRHARDEALFDPQLFDRAAARMTLGIAEDDFAIFFVGTVRHHKGVFDVARTLDAHPDKRLVLHLVGEIPDRRMRRQLETFKNARIHVHPGCAFDELPERLVAADAVVLLQDPSHAISQYQIPAKVSDAAGLGLPVIATDVPPLRDLALQGLVRTIVPAELSRTLDALMAERDSGRAVEARQRVRELFHAELGFGVNRERLAAAIRQAERARPGLPNGLERLVSIATDAYRQMRAPRRNAPAPAEPKGQIDIAMFWKQNDSGLYGRRSDMLMRHLLDSGRVRRVVQFDAPMALSALLQGVGSGPDSPASHILRNTIDAQFGLRDSDRHRMRTYLWDKRGRTGMLPGVGMDLGSYPDFVAASMAESGLRPETTIAWVCPVVFDFPAIAARIPFRGVIGDLIDDQRLFPAREVYRERIIASYRETLPLFDLTFTNCAPMVEAFGDLAGEIHVVPNGTDPATGETGPAPEPLRALKGPIAGYVGNLRDRFDWTLMREVALRLPRISFAIIGGGAREEDVAKVRDVANIHLLGVVPRDQVPACIAAFDVALMPHVRNEMTKFMNPLKIYDYFSAQKRIVATDVPNIDEDLKPFIRFASDAEGFADAVETALQEPLETGARYDHALSGILWSARARAILEKLEPWLERSGER